MSDVRLRAMNYLARREYSRSELKGRLLRLDFDEADVDAALDGLESDNLLSDERFAESFLAVKVAAGYGPRWLNFQLQGKGIDRSDASRHVSAVDVDWARMASDTLRRRFGAHHGGLTPVERRKRYQFLLRRGFEPDDIQRALSNPHEDE